MLRSVPFFPRVRRTRLFYRVNELLVKVFNMEERAISLIYILT